MKCGCYLKRDLHRYFECNQIIHECILKAAPATS